MARSYHMRGNYLGGIGNAGVRRAVNALSGGPSRSGYEQTTASGTATGLNTPNRVRNSATLAAEPNLTVNVVGNATWLIRGALNVALTAAQGIKLDFAAGTAAIVSGTMGGFVKFSDASSTTIPLVIALTALNTAVSGGTSVTWITIEFEFSALFSQSGSVQLEFAQASAGASNTDILPGSWISAEPLDYFDQSA